MEKEPARLTGHLVVCGSGRTALYTARELYSVHRPVVLVVERPEATEHVRPMLPAVPIVVGDPTQDVVLLRAGIEGAAGIVVCTESDEANLVVTLSARQLNPNARIVTRLSNVDGAQKVRLVGADSVVSPDFIGALRLASELIRPTAVTFLDSMLSDVETGLRIDEVRIPAESRAVGKQLADMGLERASQALLLAVRTEDGRWEYNPARSRVVSAGMVLVFLGSPEDSRRLCAHLDGAMIAVPTA